MGSRRRVCHQCGLRSNYEALCSMEKEGRNRGRIFRDFVSVSVVKGGLVSPELCGYNSNLQVPQVMVCLKLLGLIIEYVTFSL